MGIEPCAVLGHSVGHVAALPLGSALSWALHPEPAHQVSMQRPSLRVSLSWRMRHVLWQSGGA